MFCKNKVFYACNFINKKTLAQISFAKFLRTSFLQNSSDKQYTKAQQKDPLRFQMSCNQNSICTWIFLIRSQKYDIWLDISHTITKMWYLMFTSYRFRKQLLTGQSWKKEKQRKKRKSFKVKTIKRLSSRSKFKLFSCRPTMVTDNTFQYSMDPPLWNPFRWPCRCSLK